MKIILLKKIFQKTSTMNLNFLTTLIFILYFCLETIFCQSLFPRLKNFSSRSELYSLGGLDEEGKPLFSVSKLNPSSNQWQSATEMSSAKVVFGATVIGKKIYVAGGWSGNKYLNLLEVYDCEKNTWTELAPMENALSDIGMTTLNKQIYVAGGWDGAGSISSVMKYSPHSNIWSKVKPMNEKRHCHELITLHGTIYAISGSGTKTVERYNALFDKWTYVAPTNHSHYFFGAASHQNKIYVLSNEGFEVYNPKQNVWKDLPSLMVSNGLQLVSINKKLLAVGVAEGSNQYKASKSVYEFNLKSNSWIHLEDMDAARYLHRAVVVNF